MVWKRSAQSYRGISLEKAVPCVCLAPRQLYSFCGVPTSALMRQEVPVKTAFVGLCYLFTTDKFIRSEYPPPTVLCNNIFQVLQRYTSYSLYGYLFGKADYLLQLQWYAPGQKTHYRMYTDHHSQASTNYKEAFALFDKRGNGRVALDSLGDLLRACGQNPTLAEISDLQKNVGGDCEMIQVYNDLLLTIAVDFESFQKVLNRPGGFRDPGEPEEYCRGFQVFDKDMTGFIGVGQLRYSKKGDRF